MKWSTIILAAAVVSQIGCRSISKPHQQEIPSEYSLTYRFSQAIGDSIIIRPGTGLENARVELWCENQRVEDFKIRQVTTNSLVAVAPGAWIFRVDDYVYVHVLTPSALHKFYIGDPQRVHESPIAGTKVSWK